MDIKECQYCHAVFTVGNTKKRFCSDACRANYHAMKRKGTTPLMGRWAKRICPVCGESFFVRPDFENAEGFYDTIDCAKKDLLPDEPFAPCSSISQGTIEKKLNHIANRVRRSNLYDADKVVLCSALALAYDKFMSPIEMEGGDENDEQ